jgi:hypothetical protein
MAKFNLSEAAKDILNATVNGKRSGQDKPQKLPTSVGYGMKDAGKVGDSPEKVGDVNPDYTKGTPSATPPGATPPVGSQPAAKLSSQPGQTDGAGTTPAQDDATSYDNIRDRVAGKKPKQTMQANPGAVAVAVPEETEIEDEVVSEEKEESAKHERAEKLKKSMKEDIDALMSGENLSEEFVAKATTIFESAVLARAEEVIAEAEAELVEQFQVAVEEVKEELAAKVDDYLTYMVQEWVTENELAIEKGLRAEIVEDFITGLKGLFEQHYIDIPAEKVDVVESLTARVEELEASLNEQISKSVELTKDLSESKKIEAIYTACEGLTQTQVEKLKSLAEGVEFTTGDEFAGKLETLKESYFTESVKTADKTALDDEVLIEEETKPVKQGTGDALIEQYAKTISQTVQK